MMMQIKIEGEGNSLVFNCDLQDYNRLMCLLEMAWKNGYDTYVRRLEQDDSDDQ